MAFMVYQFTKVINNKIQFNFTVNQYSIDNYNFTIFTNVIPAVGLI